MKSPCYLCEADNQSRCPCWRGSDRLDGTVKFIVSGPVGPR